MFSKVLVANRGEIAVRVVRTCAELGLSSVAVHSDPDASALHVRLADESAPLGGTTAADSYLDIAKVLQAARDHDAEAIHPGYGFLAESADFARAVRDAGLAFIGPPPEAIAVMGEKVAARHVAAEAEVPQVPGTDGTVASAEEIQEFGTAYGYPIAIKASYGGGGRGMRLVHTAPEAAEALDAAQREALGAFGRADVYLERYLAAARHVEVQVFSDTHGTVRWLGDRDCSVQRRHQKLIEESPAPGLSADLRVAMGEASARLARTVGYVGAGTVEYLVEGDDFYFLEMNTRIQVEHPVTEEVLGLDLVAEQLNVAGGQPLSIRTSGPPQRGHAVEARINAENTAGGLFAPAPGVITELTVPHRVGVRFDSGYEAGDEVSPHYDSMVGKLIAWAPDRPTAIRRLLAALDEMTLSGVPSTVPAVRAVLEHPDFGAVEHTTQWLETSVELPAAPEPARAGDAIEADRKEGEGSEEGTRDEVWVGGRRYIVPFHSDASGDRSAQQATVRRRSGGSGSSRKPRAGSGASGGAVSSPMQGTVIAVNVHAGAPVTAGDVLFVLEAMKMENPVLAIGDGTVESVTVAAGDVVAAGATLAVLTREKHDTA